MKEKISPEEFVRLAVLRLRTGNFKGIHTVYSGFNEAYKRYYEGADPIDATNRMNGQGTISLRPVKKGMMIYLPEDAPDWADKGELALRKMGLL